MKRNIKSVSVDDNHREIKDKTGFTLLEIDTIH